MKELLERNKDNKQKLERKKLLNSSMLVLNNKCKNKKCFNSKLGHKKLNLNQPFVSKDKLDNLSKSFNNKEKDC